MVDRSSYKVGIVTSISPCTSGGASSKKLRACQVKLSENDDVDVITVVTAATNVREGSRYANRHSLATHLLHLQSLGRYFADTETA